MIPARFNWGNNNKSFTIKLNVKDLEARNAKTALQTPYDPQSIESIGSSVTLAAIDDSAITAKKPLANGTDGDAKIKEKAATVREGKTFTMTKWVLVKGNVIKTINADTEHLVFEPKSANINTETGICSFTAGLEANPTASATNYLTAKSAKSVTAAPTADTWYLATADVTYKVVKAHKDAVTADAANNVAAQDEVFLSLEETAIKVTKIASKTPITTIAATTPAEPAEPTPEP